MPLPLRGRVLSEKFRFVRRLGKGGMASVWLALNTAVDREVAIKVIRPEVLKNDDLVARFRSEAKAAGRIGHPNICEILDFGVGPIGPYIVMETLDGQNLAQVIRERGRLPADEAVTLVTEALAGLEAAHERGIVHRDLKPENVFLHRPATGDPVVKLMDFGVAKFTDGSAEVTTEHGALLGTPEYMAPEQFKGADQAEARTDIWAVGAILYRALTGKHAFKGPTVAATLLMVTHDDPTPIRELQPDVPPALVEVVARCMSKHIEDRFASVAELREAMAAAMEAPVDAPRDAERPSGEAAAAPADAPFDDSALERRPTETYQAATPPPATRHGRWVAIGAVAAMVAAGIALWPGGGTPPPPATTTPATTTPSAPPPAAVDLGAPEPPKVDVGAPEVDDEPIILEEPEPDLGTAVPADVPPPPAPDAFDAPQRSGTPPPAEPLDLPDGVIDLGGGYVLAESRGKRSNHGDARKYCEALGVTGHLGFSGWKLPFPGAVKRINATGKGQRGTYWTSARWRGNVTVFTLPGGVMKKGINADRRSARALCIAELSSR